MVMRLIHKWATKVAMVATFAVLMSPAMLLAQETTQ